MGRQCYHGLHYGYHQRISSYSPPQAQLSPAQQRALEEQREEYHQRQAAERSRRQAFREEHPQRWTYVCQASIAGQPCSLMLQNRDGEFEGRVSYPAQGYVTRLEGRLEGGPITLTERNAQGRRLGELRLEARDLGRLLERGHLPARWWPAGGGRLKEVYLRLEREHLLLDGDFLALPEVVAAPAPKAHPSPFFPQGQPAGEGLERKAQRLAENLASAGGGRAAVAAELASSTGLEREGVLRYLQEKAPRAFAEALRLGYSLFCCHRPGCTPTAPLRPPLAGDGPPQGQPSGTQRNRTPQQEHRRGRARVQGHARQRPGPAARAARPRPPDAFPRRKGSPGLPLLVRPGLQPRHQERNPLRSGAHPLLPHLRAVVRALLRQALRGQPGSCRQQAGAPLARGLQDRCRPEAGGRHARPGRRDRLLAGGLHAGPHPLRPPPRRGLGLRALPGRLRGPPRGLPPRLLRHGRRL